MRFLGTLLWIGLILLGGVFSYRNWTPVTFNLWGDRVMDTYLPVPLILAFLLGLLPAFIAYRTTKWSLTRRLANSEATLAANRQMASASAAPEQAS